MQAWDDFLTAQENELGKAVVAKWLRSLKVIRFDARNLYLEAQHAFQLMWFKQHAQEKIKKYLLNNNHQLIKVHISLPQISQPEKSCAPISPFPPDALDATATWETWVHTEENNILLHLLSHTQEFNPIYIYGPSGSGKTHLLMALTRLKKHSLYVNANTFTNHMVQAMRSANMDAFRHNYRNIDCLLIDDADSFAKRSASQEEFFHTFNALHMGNKQIIIAANMPPSQLQDMESRLVSRFEWGIALPLHPLPQSSLKELLALRCKALDVSINESVERLLLSSFSSNIHSLLKAFSALVLRAESTISSIDADKAARYLHDLMPEHTIEPLSLPSIVSATAKHYLMRTEDILGKSQNRECTLPRQIAMFLCRKHLELPFLTIGKAFGRDHSTVISSIRIIESKIESQPLKDAIGSIEHQLLSTFNRQQN